MRLRFEHGLLYTSVRLTIAGRTLELVDVIIDTGSAASVFSADRLLGIGVVPAPHDALRRIRGVGGIEVVFTKIADRVSVGEIEVRDLEIEVGAMDYGFPAHGILGLDFLTRSESVLDLRHLELRRGGSD